MIDLRLEKVNEAFIKVVSERNVAQELSDYFCFYVPGYQYTPAFKARYWDGKIRLLDLRTMEIYHGLVPYIEKFCKERDYNIEIDSEITVTDNYSLKEANDFIATLGLPFEPRDYQVKSFVHAIRNKRILLLSPTASGKSLIIYLILRYIQQTQRKGLLVVPTTSLVEQMYTDFQSYGYDSEEYCHRQYAGKDKDLGNRKRIYTDTGKSFVLPDNQLIKTLNRGMCFVKDLKEDDELPENFQK